MTKVLTTAAAVVGVAVIAVATYGLAAGPTAAAAFATDVGFSSASALTTALGLAATGLEVVGSLLAPKPGNGSATVFKLDPYAGVPQAIGRTFTAGNGVYRRTYNTPGYGLPDLQSFAVILSGGGPIAAIESFESDRPTQVYDNDNNLIASTDTRVYFDTNGNAITGLFPTWMWQTQQLGNCPETRALAKESSGPTYPPDWDASSKLSGKAAAMWTVRFDQKGRMYTNGVPAPGWVLHGVLCYDPRLDSTYPGGSGPHRWADPSNTAAFDAARATWTWSENPYLHALRFALGTWERDPGTSGSTYAKTFGIGVPIAAIVTSAFVEGANVADANGWKVGGMLYSTDDKWSDLKKILIAGSGTPMYLGGQLSCMVNTPRVVLDTVTTADIVGEVSVQATTARRDRINSIIPTYRSEAHLWEMIAALTPVTVADYVALDGGLRQQEITYDLVQDVTQASVLARYGIENAREFGPVTLPLKIRWMGYKPGDCIAATLPESGLAAQPLIIQTRNLNPGTGAVTLTCRSETAAKHAFALGQTGTAPPTPHVTGPPVVPQPTGWAIAATSLANGTATVPAIVVTGAATNLAIDGIVFEYRVYAAGVADDANWIAAGTQPAAATGIEITALLADTAYQASVSYRLGQQIGPRQIIGPETTDSPANSATTALLIGQSYTSGFTAITFTVVGGASVTASLPAHDRVYPDKTVAVAAATVTGLAFSTTYCFYYDDPTRSGGVETIVATTNPDEAFLSAANPARHDLGYGTTPSSAGTGGDGSGGGSSPRGSRGGPIP